MTNLQYQYIVAVAKYQNFTLAAEKCSVTQPTLSMQIQKIEEIMGVTLFDRSKKPIRTTEIGEKVVKQAQKILEEAKRIDDIIAQHKGFIGGNFHLGIIPTLSSSLLPIFLQTFTKKYPKINLKIQEIPTMDAAEAIIEGTLDAAILATPLKIQNIEERVLFYEPFIAYIPTQHPLAAKKQLETSDLNVTDLLMIEDTHCFHQSIVNMCEKKLENGQNSFEIKSGNFETLIKLCKEGMGMTLLPYLHTLDLCETDKKQIRTFTEPEPVREISLVYNTNKLKIGIIEALYATITGIIRAMISFENIKVISPTKSK